MSTQIGSPALNIGIFTLFVVVTLLIVYRVSRSSNTASDYYAAGQLVHRAPERHRDLG